MLIKRKFHFIEKLEIKFLNMRRNYHLDDGYAHIIDSNNGENEKSHEAHFFLFCRWACILRIF